MTRLMLLALLALAACGADGAPTRPTGTPGVGAGSDAGVADDRFALGLSF